MMKRLLLIPAFLILLSANYAQKEKFENQNKSSKKLPNPVETYQNIEFQKGTSNFKKLLNIIEPELRVFLTRVFSIVS